jgi:predicted O-linked N-acetylglucosamine transferase (SPINDLY family)
MASQFRGIPRKKPVQDQLSRQVQTQFRQALALHQKGRLGEAQAIYQQILKVQPRHFDSLHLLGVAAVQTGRLELGIQLIGEAIEVNPNVASAYYSRGNALLGLKRPDEALASYDKALALKPDYADAHTNRGNALRSLERLDEALTSYDKALSLNPGCADAYNNRGSTLRGLKRLDEALASYDKALSLQPGWADAYNNRGNALRDLNRLDEALASYEKALSLKPDCDFLLGTLLHARMTRCDWDGLPQSLSLYEGDISRFKRVSPPFPALSLLDAPELHKIVSTVYAEAKYPKSQALGPINRRPADGRIRIGYYSADFHNHATASLMAQLFETHNAERFELYGFSFGPDRHDGMRKRVSSAFDRFIEVTDKSDREVATLSRELGIDIAVDLKGFTKNSRTRIFAEGCAPVQVNYLGYPGTMGAEYIDYIIADRTVIPEQGQSAFVEKVVYLPHSYQVNDLKRRISERAFTRQELGLPESGFVFCCFNNNFKILPATFDGWMRILNAVEGSVLWLFEDSPTAAGNLRKEAEKRGVESDRLVFARRMPLDEHLARHRLADLFIDTLPYNAHTTASDALWAGLPVLTCMGKSFASRVAGSLLNAVGMDELITHTQADYEARAVELATTPGQLEQLKSKLEKNRLVAPLFDGTLFARHIESAYEMMHARYQAGLPPASIVVQPHVSQAGSR